MVLGPEHSMHDGDDDSGKVCCSGDKACYMNSIHDVFCHTCLHALHLDNNHVYKLFFVLYNDVCYDRSHVPGHLHHNS